MTSELTGERLSSAGDASAAIAAVIRITYRVKLGAYKDTLSALDAATRVLRDPVVRNPRDVPSVLKSIPIPFRGILRLTLAGGDAQGLLKIIQLIFVEEQRAKWDKFVSLAYPLFICVAACVGIFFVAMFNTPLLIALETPFELSTVVITNTSNPVLRSMLMPAAVVACILLLTGAVFFAVNQKSRIVRNRDSMFLCQCRAVIDTLDLTEVEQADIWTDLVSQKKSESDESSSPLVQQVLKMPRLSRSSCMTYIVGWYRQRFLSSLARRKNSIPIVGAVVAGGVVLLYGVALMQPLVELFTSIADLPVVPIWSPGL